MRHRNGGIKIGRTGAHNRCMFANMLKSLVENERVETTVTKAKELRRHADHLITLAKRGGLADRRAAISEMMVTFNALSPKERRAAKGGDTSSYNADRRVLAKLFDVLGPRFKERSGGYTRLVKTANRVGDNAVSCIVEYLSA